MRGGRRRRLPPILCAALAVACTSVVDPSACTSCEAFAPPTSTARAVHPPSVLPPSLLFATRPSKSEQASRGKPKSTNNKSSNRKGQKSKYKTIGDMMQALERNPNDFASDSSPEVNASGRRIDGRKKPKRTRRRVDRPKQKYLYASQRRMLGADEKSANASGDDAIVVEEGGEPQRVVNPQTLQRQQQAQKQLEFLRSLGLNPAAQAADAVVGDGPEDAPRIASAIRVDGNDGDGLESVTSNSFAYVLYKPVGWGIVGEKKKGGKKRALADETDDAAGEGAPPPTEANAAGKQTNKVKRVKAYDEQVDDFTFVEYDESDILAVLTPEERAELMKEGGLKLDDAMAEAAKGALAGAEYDDDDESAGLYDESIAENSASSENKKKSAATAVAATRMRANINPPSRPSLVNWLKDLKAAEGTPIKGGKNWAALAGATDIDDSGLVLLCPKDRTDAVHVDRAGYLAVVGNAKKLTSRSKLLKSAKSNLVGETYDESTAQIEILSRVKRGRDADPVATVAIDLTDGASTCSHAVLLCQERLGDGVRGDPQSDPLDRRASRRLVHCESIAVSSLVNLDDEPVDAECDVPDDVASYANRRDDVGFQKGSFLGRRMGLAQNGMTTAYREVNGAADGFPGWIADRYDQWLFVQHEEGPTAARGPLPSLHDGCTAGVYYLPTKADRSIMGSEKLKPALLEGQPAPEFIPVKENGVSYLVNLGDSFSTGLFLDQRLQRAWLAERCNEDTRVLNCFAHAGGFSVAAATAGAKTVSLDLDRKWLDRIRPQMEANGIAEWEGRHDCIYGDCFDWLARLAKRGEQFDIVILDPPSTSVGKKKKRWSVKNDMSELVALAAPLVKSGGLLFTTTNAATLRHDKFARMCKKGLEDAGVANARLERIGPMPSDFSSIGPQPVKNLVWRVPARTKRVACRAPGSALKRATSIPPHHSHRPSDAHSALDPCLRPRTRKLQRMARASSSVGDPRTSSGSEPRRFSSGSNPRSSRGDSRGNERSARSRDRPASQLDTSESTNASEYDIIDPSKPAWWNEKKARERREREEERKEQLRSENERRKTAAGNVATYGRSVRGGREIRDSRVGASAKEGGDDDRYAKKSGGSGGTDDRGEIGARPTTEADEDHLQAKMAGDMDLMDMHDDRLGKGLTADEELQGRSIWDLVDRSTLMVGCCLILVVIIAITIPVALISEDEPYVAPLPCPPPTASPTRARDTERDAIGERLAKITPGGMGTLLNPSTAHHRAWQWLVYEDGMELGAAKDHLHQRYVLVVIYFISGPWTPVEGRLEWLSPVHECEWEGVFCKDVEALEEELEGRIEELLEVGREDGIKIDVPQRVANRLELRQRLVSGEVPSEFSLLYYLQHLDLENNQLVGALPTPLYKLFNLQTLFLEANELTNVDAIGEYRHLEHLALSKNNFRGGLPESFQNLKKLKTLYLHTNAFTGMVFETLKDFESMELLDLAFNEFEGTLPAELGNMKNLTSVFAGHNRFQGTIPAAIGNCKNLKQFQMDGSLDMGGPIPVAFGQLPLLEFLKLDTCAFSGTLPASLGNLGKLSFLDVNSNELEGGIPIQLGKATALKTLGLANNNFLGGVPGELGNLVNLEKLYLQNTDLTGPMPAEVCALRERGDETVLEVLWAPCDVCGSEEDTCCTNCS
ncbi:hypothetical protein ACHAXT_011224 [Thalassiosira profunda]